MSAKASAPTHPNRDPVIASLLANEERLRMAMQAANIGAFDWNIRTGELRWSPNLEEIMGYPPTGAARTVEDFWAHVHPDDLSAVRQAIDIALKTGREYQFDFRMIRLDGSVRWLQARGQVHFGEDGTPDRLVGIDFDITESRQREHELRQAEEALRRSEAQARARAEELAALLDVVPAMLFIAHDPECLKMTSSRAAYEMLRIPQGSNSSKSAPEGERPEHFRTMRDGREIPLHELPVQQAAFTGQDVRDAELSVAFEDGSSVDILGNAIPLFDSQGKVRGAVGAFIEVTARKRADRDLRHREEELSRANESLQLEILERLLQLAQFAASEERVRKLAAQAAELNAKFHAVFDQSAYFDAIVALDGTILETNRTCLEACGYKPEQALGWLFWETPWWREDEAVQAKLRHAFEQAAQGISYREELPYVCADGAKRIVDFLLVPVRDDSGQIILLHPSGTDITERKLVEDRIRHLNENLEAAVNDRTRELEQQATRLARQSAQLQSLSQRLMEVQDEERRRLSRELHDSVGQLLAILCIHLGALKRQLEKSPSEVAQRIQESYEIGRQIAQEIRTMSYLLHPPLLEQAGLATALDVYVAGLAARSGMQIKLDVPPDFPRLSTDLELTVFRVVQECLTNIHKHSGSKTALIRFVLRSESLLIHVQDSGCGISPEKLAEIRSHGAGAGVGMQGMRERIRPHGGYMHIESSTQGTTVSITLPLKPAAPSEDEGIADAAR